MTTLHFRMEMLYSIDLTGALKYGPVPEETLCKALFAKPRIALHFLPDLLASVFENIEYKWDRFVYLYDEEAGDRKEISLVCVGEDEAEFRGRGDWECPGSAIYVNVRSAPQLTLLGVPPGFVKHGVEHYDWLVGRNFWRTPEQGNQAHWNAGTEAAG